MEDGCGDVWDIANFVFEQKKGCLLIYSAKVSRDKTQSSMLSDLLNRAFDGSANALVSHLLEQAEPNSEELDEIHKTITRFTRKKGDA